MPEELPPAVRTLIARSITSIQKLEVLLLVAREPAREWSAQEVYESSLTSRVATEQWLDEMVREGVLEKTHGPTPTYRCQQETTLLDALHVLTELFWTAPWRLFAAIYDDRESKCEQPA